MVLNLRLRADRQLHSDITSFKDEHGIHHVIVIRRFQRNIRANLVPGDPGLTPVVQNVDLDRAIVICAGCRVIAGDARIRCDDLLVGRWTIFFPAFAVHSMSGGLRGTGAIADLIVFHHPHFVTFDVRLNAAGGVGSACVVYEASSSVLGSCRAIAFPVQFFGSMRVGSLRMATSLRESGRDKSSFLTAMRILLEWGRPADYHGETARPTSSQARRASLP